MSATPSVIPQAAPSAEAEDRARAAARRAAAPGDFFSLTKPRLTFLVLITTVAGFLVAPGPADPTLLLHTVAGTWMIAAAASAFNQVVERRQDAAMSRTRTRPLPSGRMAVTPALAFAAALFAAGALQLATLVNPLVAALGIATTASYVLLYTPLKRMTPKATLVGAVPGAIPPMMGWAASTGSLGAEPLALFLVLFFWQLPHFLAIALLFREDYERAGFKVLPVVAPGGRATAVHATAYAAALLPAGLLPWLLGMSGPGYAVASLLLGATYLATAVRLLRSPDEIARARVLFRSSLVYLPLLLAAMLLPW